MALKTLLLGQQIKMQEDQLAQLREQDASFETREAELTQAISEVETDEQRTAVETMVTEFESERDAHVAAVTALEGEIEQLRTQLAELESKEPPAPANSRGAEPKTEREGHAMSINIRSLPRGQRAFEAVFPTAQERAAVVAQNDVQTFFGQIRSIIANQRAVTGAQLTVPVTFLDIIAENMFRYSKLMNRVRIRDVRGESRQTVAGLVPEAVWEGCCDALNELEFAFSQVDVTCNKVGGYILLCNALKEESDVNLASTLIEMISESIGMAKDKAILYGKGQAYKMPLGIVTRLAQESKPDSYPVDAPEWIDLHTSNIKSIAADLTGAAFWAALTVACGRTFSRYSRGEQFWAMNSNTYNLLKSKAITFTASGDVVSNVLGLLPIINGNIEILEFMPDGDIVGGYGDLYLWAQHAGMVIGTDMAGFTLRVKDATLFWGKERGDGAPIIPGAFVAINIAGSAPTTSMTFAGNSANDATLQSLTVGSLNLSPSFDAGVQTYTASAASSVTSAAINATPAQADAEVAITVTHNGTTKTVNNGAAAALAAGENVIAVTVKKGNATVVYTVTVTHA